MRAAIALSALNERTGAGYVLLLNDLATKAAIRYSVAGVVRVHMVANRRLCGRA